MLGNKLNNTQEELLFILSEECAEVIQAVQKCLRHGTDSYNPLVGDHITNEDELEKEIGHVWNIVEMLIVSLRLDLANIIKCKEYKKQTINKYLHN